MHRCCPDLPAGLEKWLSWNRCASVRLAGSMPQRLSGAEVLHHATVSAPESGWWHAPFLTPLVGAVRLKWTPAQMRAKIQDRGKVKGSLQSHKGNFFCLHVFSLCLFPYVSAGSDEKWEDEVCQDGGQDLQFQGSVCFR